MVGTAASSRYMRRSLLLLLSLCAIGRAASAQAVPLLHPLKMDTLVAPPVSARMWPAPAASPVSIHENWGAADAITWFIDSKRVFIPAYYQNAEQQDAVADARGRLNPDDIKNVTVLKGAAAERVGACPGTAVLWIETRNGNYSTRTRNSGRWRVDLCPGRALTDSP
ncbi:MAG: hypothetical protein ABJE47_16135 [bacterium]